MQQTPNVQSVHALATATIPLCEELDDEPPPVHRWVSAAGCTIPSSDGYTSVFDLAAMAQHCGLLKLFGARSMTANQVSTTIQERTHTIVTREPGTIRCKRIHYTETREWQEQETARRARQIVPKPPKQSFRVGKKAKALQDG